MMTSIRVRRRAMLAAVAGAAWLAAFDGGQAAPCDRACLSGALTAYVAALYRHDPQSAHLAPGYRETENAAPVAAGQGLWKTATGPGTVQRVYVDMQTGQVALFGEVAEGAATDIVSLRVKVVDKRVTEAEWTIARPGSGMFSPQGLEAQPPPDQPLPLAQRMTRAQLVAGADAYLQALQDHDGSRLPHRQGCERVENGVRVTNRTGPPPAMPGAAMGAPGPMAGGAPVARMEMRSGDCVAGFDHFAHTIASTDLRRYPVADTEKGVVLGETLFHRPPGVALKRNLLNEYFWQSGGQITGMYAAMYYLPDDAPDGNGGWK